jgi:hypothetical protein
MSGLSTTLFVIATLGGVVWTPIQARRVRDGWVRPNFTGTREEFVAKHRRYLRRNGWLFVAVGALIGTCLLVSVVVSSDGVRTYSVAEGVFVAAVGISSLLSRRILDSPPST